MRRATLVVLILVALVLVPATASPVVAETSGVDIAADAMSDAMGTVRGNVTDGTNPIAGATVVMISVNETKERRAPTTSMGSFSIPDLEPGVYIMYAEKEGYSSGKITGSNFKTVSSGVNIIDLTLTGQPSTLTGTVLFEQQPLADVEVTVSSGNFSRPPVTTSSEGRYVISNIPAGNYTVTFSKNGYRTVETTVNLEPEGFKSQDMEMERMGLPISEGFLGDYDLAHSLMIVGLGLAISTLVLAILVRYRVRKRPDLLSEEDESET